MKLSIIQRPFSNPLSAVPNIGMHYTDIGLTGRSPAQLVGLDPLSIGAG